jgi:type 1 fimbria pilin
MQIAAFHTRLSKGMINMSHFFKLSQTTALVCTLGVAGLTSLPAQAADDGTLTIKAGVSKATCAVIIGDNPANPGNSSYKTLNLGNIASNNKSSIAGEKFGRPVQIQFALTNPEDTSKACDLTALSSGWQLKTNFNAATQFTTVGTGTSAKNYLKNEIPATAGGTNAVVTLGVGVRELVLKDQENIIVGLGNGTNIATMWAQFVYATTGQATPGKFNFIMPVTVAYK